MRKIMEGISVPFIVVVTLLEKVIDLRVFDLKLIEKRLENEDC